MVDEWGWDSPSTKSAVGALASLGTSGRVLVVLRRDDEAVWKSFRNLPDVQVLDVAELNAYDVLCNDWLVFTRETLPGGTDGVEAETATDEAATGDVGSDDAGSDDQGAPDPEGDGTEAEEATS